MSGWTIKKGENRLIFGAIQISSEKISHTSLQWAKQSSTRASGASSFHRHHQHFHMKLRLQLGPLHGLDNRSEYAQVVLAGRQNLAAVVLPTLRTPSDDSTIGQPLRTQRWRPAAAARSADEIFLRPQASALKFCTLDWIVRELFRSTTV